MDVLKFVAVRMVTHGFLEEPSHFRLELGKGVLGTYIDPVPELVTGQVKEWAEIAGVETIQIPGYWTHKRGEDIAMGAKPKPGEKVLYYMHGGGYITSSAHPSTDVSVLSRDILEHCASAKRVFSIEYRLCTPDVMVKGTLDEATKANPGPFPAALIDALAGYNYLVNVVGFDPEDVIFVGDSAGGNLALALTRYLIDCRVSLEHTPPALPGVPGSLLLLSPWSDLGDSHDLPTLSRHTEIKTDFAITRPDKSCSPSLLFISPAFGPSFPATNPYLSPASLRGGVDITFRGFPRTFINGGGSERLRDEIRTLEKRMRQDLGNEMVTYYEAPDAVHDYLIFPWHEPERSETLSIIGSWVGA